MDSITAVPFDMDDKIHVSNSIIYCVLTKKGLENIMNDKSNNEPFMYERWRLLIRVPIDIK